VAVAGCVLVLGTVTTGTGPHAGSGGDVERLPFPLERVTQLHADSALFLTGLIVATVVAVRLTSTPPAVRRRANWLVVAVLAQVSIGYTQYFLNLPPSIVELHVAGATVLWSVTVWMHLGYTVPAPDRSAHPPAAGKGGYPVPDAHAAISGPVPDVAFPEDDMHRLPSSLTASAHGVGAWVPLDADHRLQRRRRR
jgi:hypothetical protein